MRKTSISRCLAASALVCLTLGPAAADQLYIRNHPFKGMVTHSGGTTWVDLKAFAEAMGAKLVQDGHGGYSLGVGAAAPAAKVLVAGQPVEAQTSGDEVLVSLEQATPLMGARVIANRQLGTIDVSVAHARIADTAPPAARVAKAKSSEAYPPTPAKNLYAKSDVRGQKAPDLHVEKWLAGANPSLSGKVILVDMWATWCPPCRALIPELNAYQKKLGSKLVVIGLSDEPEATITELMKTHPMNYSVATDTSGALKAQLGVSGIPHVLVISPDHVVRYQGFPSSDQDPLTEETLSKIIKASE